MIERPHVNKRSEDDGDTLRAKANGLEEDSIFKSQSPALEEELAEQERFRALLDQADDFIFIFKAKDGRLVDVSRSASQRLGYSREEILDMHFQDFVPAWTWPLVKDFCSRGDRWDRSELLTTVLHKRNGEDLPVEISLRLAAFLDTLYAFAVARDISPRIDAEESLKLSEESYRALVNSSSDAILMVDTDRRIVACNQAFLDLFAFDREEDAVGQSMRIVYPSEESFLALGERAHPIIEERGSFRGELELMRRDGQILSVEETLSAVRDPDGTIKFYVAVIRDITRRKKAEAELKRHRDNLEEMIRERTRDLEAAQKALIQKEKLKTLGALSAEIAHEIRNPLVVIGGFARRLQKRFPTLPEVSIILDETRRLEMILSRIKHYLKPIEMRPQVCSVDQVIMECMDLLAPELQQAQAAWQLDLQPDLSPAYVDPGILIEVLINLVRNAVRLMDTTGALTIRTYETDKNVHIDFQSPVIRMKIKDPELFLLPFYEAGQDIGIPLCFRLLKDMGGLLAFTRESDRMTFTVSLPKAPQEAIAKEETENRSSP